MDMRSLSSMGHRRLRNLNARQDRPAVPTLAADLQGSMATPVVPGRRPTFIANGAFRKKRPAPESAEDPVLQTQDAAEWGVTETSPPLNSVTGGKNLS